MANEALLARCVWPELPEPYNQSLREAVAFALERYPVLGIIAAGSIVRGCPDRTSDLDLCVLHGGTQRQRVQRTFNGVPAEIFANPPAAIEHYLIDERAARRPIMPHMLATGRVVLALDPVVADLRARAAAVLADPPAAPEDLTINRYLAATLYEDAADVAEKDPAIASMLLADAVREMLRLLFICRGRYLPRLKDTLRGAAEIDPEVAGLASRFYLSGDLNERLDLAGQIADRVAGARGFFAWESVPEVYPRAADAP
jgi:hypothetical protein